MSDSRHLSAYKNDATLKAAFVGELHWHREADAFIKGTYGNDQPNGKFKGCGIGCSINSMVRIHRKNPEFFSDPVIVNASTSHHSLMESLLGIPAEIAHLCDTLFERLESQKRGKGADFIIRMAEAIQPGADLTVVIPHWIYWTLTDDVRPTKYPQCQEFIDAVVALYKEWTETDVKPSRDLAYLGDRAYLAYLAYLR